MTFDAQNPIVSSIVGETDIGKNDVFSKIITKAPNPIDIELKFQLDRLIARVGNKNNNNNNNNFLPPPPPPPPSTNNLNFPLPPVFELPPLDDLSNLPGVPNFLPKSIRSTGTQSKVTFPGDKLIDDLEKVIEKKPKQKILAHKNIVVDLSKATEIILDKFEIELDKKKQTEKDLINEFNLQHLYDKINDGYIPQEFNFFFQRREQNFFQVCGN